MQPFRTPAAAVLRPCICVQWAFLKLHILRVRKVKMAILSNMSSIVRPGRATLVLGPPGAGKSTLLKALAGKLKPDGLKVPPPLLLHHFILQEGSGGPWAQKLPGLIPAAGSLVRLHRASRPVD